MWFLTSTLLLFIECKTRVSYTPGKGSQSLHSLLSQRAGSVAPATADPACPPRRGMGKRKEKAAESVRLWNSQVPQAFGNHCC